jgi:hypothetical protein
MSNVPRIHQGLGFLVLTLGLLQYFLAGLGAFGAETGYDPHRAVGSLLTVLALVLLILAAVGRRAALVPSAVLLGLMLVQTVLAISGEDVAFLGALHPVNGLLILFVAHQTARGLPLPFGNKTATSGPSTPLSGPGSAP